MALDGNNGLADRIEDWIRVKKLPGIAQKVGHSPARGLNGVRLADPAQLLLDPPGDGSEQVGCPEFGQGRGVSFDEATVSALQDGQRNAFGSLLCLASARRTSSTALVTSCTA